MGIDVHSVSRPSTYSILVDLLLQSYHGLRRLASPDEGDLPQSSNLLLGCEESHSNSDRCKWHLRLPYHACAPRESATVDQSVGGFETATAEGDDGSPDV